MLVPVQCQQCSTHYLIEDKFAGRRAKCRKCGEVMPIPVPGPGGRVASSMDDTDGLGTPSIEPGPWGAPASAEPPKFSSQTAPAPPPLPVAASPAPYVPPAPPALPPRPTPANPRVSDDDDEVPVDGIPMGQWRPEDVIIEREVEVEEATAALEAVPPSVARQYAHRPQKKAAAAATLAPVDGLAPLLLFLLLGLSLFTAIQGSYQISSGTGPLAKGGVTAEALWGNLLLSLVLLFVLVGPLALGGITVAANILRFEMPSSSYLRACALVAVPQIVGRAMSIAVMYEVASVSLAVILFLSALPLTFFALRWLFGTRWLETLLAYVLAGVFGIIGALIAGAIVGMIVAFVFMRDASSQGGAPSPGGVQATSPTPTPAPRATLNRQPEPPSPSPIIQPPPAVVAPVPAPVPVQPAPVEPARPVQPVQPIPAPAVPGVDPSKPTVFGAPRAPANARGDFLARVRAAAGPVVTDASVIPLQGDEVAIVRPLSSVATLRGTADPHPYALVAGTAAQESVMVMAGSPPALTGDKTLDVKLGRRGHYALSPDGARLIHVATTPALAARVVSVADDKEFGVIPLDANLGQPSIIGFLGGPDRFAIRWEREGKHGLEVWDLRNTKRYARQVDLPDYDPSPGNEAVSPDGRLFARAAPFNGRTHLFLHSTGTSAAPRRFPVDALGEAAAFVPASGIAFSTDGTTVAALFVEAGNGVVVAWSMKTGQPLVKPGVILPGAVTPLERLTTDREGRPTKAPSLHWIPGTTAVLVAGNIITDAATGSVVADLDTTGVFDQSVTRDGVIHLAFRDRERPSGIAVLTLDMTKLPVPASAKPATRPAVHATTRPVRKP